MKTASPMMNRLKQNKRENLAKICINTTGIALTILSIFHFSM